MSRTRAYGPRAQPCPLPHAPAYTAQVQKVLRGGTEYAYSALAFSPDGAQLASVGGPSDYLLAVWDWAAGSVLLRCKAFSQEVYTLAFAAGAAGRLVTSGLGHIRFWRMASTFTGLKLQVSGRKGGGRKECLMQASLVMHSCRSAAAGQAKLWVLLWRAS